MTRFCTAGLVGQIWLYWTFHCDVSRFFSFTKPSNSNLVVMLWWNLSLDVQFFSTSFWEGGSVDIHITAVSVMNVRIDVRNKWIVTWQSTSGYSCYAENNMIVLLKSLTSAMVLILCCHSSPIRPLNHTKATLSQISNVTSVFLVAISALNAPVVSTRKKGWVDHSNNQCSRWKANEHAIIEIPLQDLILLSAARLERAATARNI